MNATLVVDRNWRPSTRIFVGQFGWTDVPHGRWCLVDDGGAPMGNGALVSQPLYFNSEAEALAFLERTKP